MNNELTEIHQLRRKGVRLVEFWSFILNSQRHKDSWIEYRPEAQLELNLWEFLLKEKQIGKLQELDKKAKYKDPSQVFWMDILVNYRPIIRRQAIEHLGKSKIQIPLKIKGLAEFHKDPNNDTRKKTKEYFTRILKKAKAQEIVPVLIQLLHDKHPKLLWWVTGYIGQFKSKAKDAVPVLEQLLKKRHYWLQDQILETLYQIGPPAIPCLLSWAKDKEYGPNALTQIAKMKKKAKTAVPGLIEQIKSKKLIKDCIFALGEIGFEAREAIPLLKEKKNGKHKLIQQCALEALRKIEKKK